MDRLEARTRLLVAAEELFYAEGIHAVGMNKVRDRSGVSLARLYDLFPSKQHLVAGYLRARDERWRRRLAAHVDATASRERPRSRLLAVFDWLTLWFTEPGFRGCGFINAWAETTTDDSLVLVAVEEHKTAFHDYLSALAGSEVPDEVVDQLYLLAEGAIVTAAITGRLDTAHTARTAAARLLQSSAR
ncbi:TetR/AcrR family transcriptional regulator [Pseudonocardia sp. TMWB2A]|uniref:TetR/AcrR family transcriptional regulator n=1 Tax=Pseudonocardia sp. TMWB2A TaxID=687430 RepID=UPI00307F7284